MLIDQTVHHFTETISQDIGYNEVYRVGRYNGTEITDLFCPGDLRKKDKVYLVEPFHLIAACMEVPYQSHHFGPQCIPALFTKENWYPNRAQSALAIRTPNSSLDLFNWKGTGQVLLLREGYRQDRGRRPILVVGWSSIVESIEMVCQRLAHRNLVSIGSIPNPDPLYVIMPPASVCHQMKEAGVGISRGQLELARLLPPVHLLAKI